MSPHFHGGKRSVPDEVPNSPRCGGIDMTLAEDGCQPVSRMLLKPFLDRLQQSIFRPVPVRCSLGRLAVLLEEEHRDRASNGIAGHLAVEGAMVCTGGSISVLLMASSLTIGSLRWERLVNHGTGEARTAG